MSFIQQFFTSRDNNANAETFVGQEGRLWWDPVTNQIYSSDGNTPGGIPLAGGGGGNGTPGGSNSQVQFNNSGTFGGSANLTFNRVNGALTAVSFVGDGAGLSNITGANVVGEVTNATYASSAVTAINAETVTANAQPNINSLGILTELSATGNVTGNYFIGNGSLLTGISSGSSNTIFNGNSNVVIATTNGNVTITANTSQPYTWTFDTTGAFESPGKFITTAGNTSARFDFRVNGDGGGSDLEFGADAPGSQYFLASVQDPAGRSAEFWLNAVDEGNLNAQIRTFDGMGTTMQWDFNGNGDLILPGNTAYIGADTGQISIYSDINAETAGMTVVTNSATSIFNEAAINLTTNIADVPHQWQFDQTGNLTIPGSIVLPTLGSIMTSGYNNPELLTANADSNWAYGFSSDNVANYYTQVKFFGDHSTTRGFRILDSDSGNVWLFNGNGGLTFPDTTVQTTAFTGTATTVTANAQPNITSVGTLSSVSVSGNINTVGTLNINSTTGNYNVLNITGTALVPYGGSQTWQFFTQNTALGGPGSWILFPDSSQQTTAYPGTSSTLSLTGNVTGNYVIGNGSALTSVTGANVTGTVANATYAVSAGSATTAGTVTTAAQPNITSVGTLSSLTVTGNITGGNLLTGGLLSSTGNITSAANIAGGNLTAVNQVITGNGSITQPGFRFAGDVDTGFFLLADGNLAVTTNSGTRAIFFDSGLNVPGVISASGNVTTGNLLTGGLISATGNVTGGNINTAGRVSATGNINAGNLITTGAVYSNYNTNTANTGSFMAQGGNTKGGTGYLDFLVVQNTSGGATNPYKWFRTTSDGQFQIINSAYTQNIFNLTDAGNVAIPGQIFINGAQTTNGPAFSAYAAAILQTIPNNAQTKVLFQTEEFDTNNCYANSRFTPTAAGYYQLNAEVRLDGSSGTGEMMIILYKNGSEYKRGTNQSGTQIASNFWAMQVSSVAYANGLGDYFEIYVQQGSGSDRTVTAVNNLAITWFNGCMLRGA